MDIVKLLNQSILLGSIIFLLAFASATGDSWLSILLVIIFSYLFYTKRENSQKNDKKSRSSYIFDGIEVVLLAISVVNGLALNVRDALVVFTLFLIFAMFRQILFLYLNNKEKHNLGLLNESLVGGGILAFAIITYIISVPIFVTDGTESCKSYDMIDTGGKFQVNISDLTVRVYDARPVGLQIRTKVYGNIECSGCDTGPQIKPDGNLDNKQITNVTLSIPKNTGEFSFAQMISQKDLIPIIGNTTVMARSCSCVLAREDGKVICNPMINTDPTVRTWLFTATPGK